MGRSGDGQGRRLRRYLLRAFCLGQVSWLDSELWRDSTFDVFVLLLLVHLFCQIITRPITRARRFRGCAIGRRGSV